MGYQQGGAGMESQRMGSQQTGQQAGGQLQTGAQGQTGGQLQAGQQIGQQSSGSRSAQEMEMTRQEGLSGTHQEALQGIAEAIQVCAWCADQCVQEASPEMTQCIRLCEDVAELGEAAHVLLARNSQYSTPLLGTLRQAMEACANECARQAHGHCQDCATTLDRVANSITQFTGQTGQQL